jgi:hypothetical protein
MSVFLLSILRIALAAAAVVWLWIDLMAERLGYSQGAKARNVLLTILVAITAYAGLLHLNLGFGGAPSRDYALSDRFVHRHEQFHFFFAAKYLPELRYDGLYDATVLALREDLGDSATMQLQSRDQLTFVIEPTEARRVDQQAVRARFTQERWEMFKQDMRVFQGPRPWSDMQGYLLDRGNTASPAWTIAAFPFVATALPTDAVLLGLATLDWALLGVAIWAVGRALGVRVAMFAAIILLLTPLTNGYLLGSFLRYDWLAAVFLGVAALSRKHWTWAGVALTYAMLSRIFPGAFWVMPLLWMGVQLVRLRRWDRNILQVLRAYGLGTVAAITIFVGASSLVFGAQRWPEYWQRAQVTATEGFYPLHYDAAFPITQVITQGIEAFDHGLLPPVFAQADQASRVAALPYLRGFQFLVIAWVVQRLWGLRDTKDMYRSVVYAVPLLFATTLLNIYYYSMLAVVAIALAGKYSVRAGIQVSVALSLWIIGYLLYHYAAIGHLGYVLSWFGLVWLVAMIGYDAVQAATLRWRQKRVAIG